MEIKWTDTDLASGQKRFLCANRFANKWTFKFKFTKRGEWNKDLQPTREMWNHILDGLKRRYQRREIVDEREIDQVVKILAKFPPEDEQPTESETHG
ncbi:MAG: hypothetical protein EXR99_10730 [Gemmataceae bacterium]|nr:hypothetical protein [Gemmataceae bacterium]